MNSAEFCGYVEDVKRSIIDTMELIKSLENCCDDSFQADIKKIIDENAKERLDLAERLIRLKAKNKRIDGFVNRAADEAHTVDEFDTICNRLFEKDDKKRANIKKTTEYKLFKREFDAACGYLNASTLEAEVTEVNGNNVIAMYDPWSKALMVNPVRNTKCGHHYDHDSVKAVIKGNLDVRCPIVGCASEFYIQPNHLEPDPSLRDQIKAFREHELLDSSSDDDN